jgi:hypothetical protein
MTGVKAPVGVLGASVVMSSHAVKGTLPFTGIALSVYVAVGFALIMAGLVLRMAGRTQR